MGKGNFKKSNRSYLIAKAVLLSKICDASSICYYPTFITHGRPSAKEGKAQELDHATTLNQ